MEKTFSDRVKTAREAAGLTMTELARRLNVSKQVVWAWENGGIKDPKLVHALALRDALCVSIDWLVYGKGEMHEKNPFPTLTERQKNLLILFDALPESEQKEFFQSLQDKKSYFDAIIKELLAKRKS